jgi:hypothetical protein
VDWNPTVEPGTGKLRPTRAPDTPMSLPSVIRPVMFTAIGLNGSNENLNGACAVGATIALCVAIE